MSKEIKINVQVDENEQPIIVETSQYYAPVQSVNGKIGFVTITQQDLGISGGFASSGDLNNYYLKSNPSGYITGVDTSNFYTKNNPSGFITGVDTSNFYTKDNPSGFITSENVIYTSGNQAISGQKDFAVRPTVSNTGVLLSGQNSFVIQTSTSQSNLANANTLYFFMGHSAGYSVSRTDRPTPFLEACTVKKVSITLQQANASTTGFNITGYLINTTKNLTGIVFTAANTTADANFYHYTNSNLNIPFSEGDSGACGIFSTTAAVTNLRSMANIYCYN